MFGETEFLSQILYKIFRINGERKYIKYIVMNNFDSSQQETVIHKGYNDMALLGIFNYICHLKIILVIIFF